MELTNDLMASLRARVSPAVSAPCWTELRARLCAAHAAGVALSRAAAATPGPRGGFAEWYLPRCAANASRPV